MAFVKSQAETGKDYVVLQGALYSPTTLHIQGVGRKANRSYGISANVQIPSEFGAYLAKQATPNSSKAGTGRRYMKLAARPRLSCVHFQVVDGVNNRGYGAAFDVPRQAAQELWTWLVENYFDE